MTFPEPVRTSKCPPKEDITCKDCAGETLKYCTTGPNIQCPCQQACTKAENLPECEDEKKCAGMRTINARLGLKRDVIVKSAQIRKEIKL